MKTRMRKTVAVCALLLGLVSLLLRAAEEPLDWDKVRRLHQRAQAGEKLTPEEQAYYEKGKAARLQKEKAGVNAGEKSTVKSPAAGKAGKASTSLVPISDMGAGQKYKDQDGGLYGGGANTPPTAHLKAALAAAKRIQPLDAAGKPSPGGKIILLTHGMSNTTQESQAFIRLANADARKNPAVLIVDGAQGGIDSRQWVSGRENRKGAKPWETLDERIKAAGGTNEQVQVVWMKHAIAGVGQFGEFPKHAQQLQDDLGEIVRLLKKRFVHLQLVYASSRTYAGYATTQLNPEPYAYESAFAVRGVIQDQISGNEALSYSAGRAPVLLWGPYIWADGTKGRAAGDLYYERPDFVGDGTHPSDSGRQKVAEQLVKHFTTDPTAAPWFVK